MSFHSWLQNLCSALATGRGQRRHRRRSSPRAATHRLNLEVLEDRSLPSFSPATSFPVGPNPQAVVTGDFNNDGKLDLAVANHDDGTVSVLSKGEFSLLVVFLGAPHRILNRDQLLELSRLHNDEVYNRAVDIQIMRLRRKIEPEPAKPKYIRTERGNGYVFGVNVETVY